MYIYIYTYIYGDSCEDHVIYLIFWHVWDTMCISKNIFDGIYHKSSTNRCDNIYYICTYIIGITICIWCMLICISTISIYIYTYLYIHLYTCGICVEKEGVNGDPVWLPGEDISITPMIYHADITCIHTYIHACIHTYIHIYIYIHIYLS